MHPRSTAFRPSRTETSKCVMETTQQPCLFTKRRFLTIGWNGGHPNEESMKFIFICLDLTPSPQFIQHLTLTIQNTIGWPLMPTTVLCFFILCRGTKQTQEQFIRLWDKNLAITHTVVLILKWRPHFGMHTNPRTKCMIAARRRSHTRQNILGF